MYTTTPIKGILCFLLMLQSSLLMAQQQVEFDTVPSDTEGEIIYKGTCAFTDISVLPAFNWEANVAAYEPDVTSIAVLRDKLPAYQLVVFLGTWCEDSHRLIPQLYKVLEATGYPLEQVQLEALDRDKKGKDNREVQYEVLFVPTVLVLQDGVVIGRITETVQQSVEEDLLKMLP